MNPDQPVGHFAASPYVAMRLPVIRLTLLIAVLLAVATTLSAQTITFSGRVTEQSNGQGISCAVVVAEGNVTGTRVAITDG